MQGNGQILDRGRVPNFSALGASALEALLLLRQLLFPVVVALLTGPFVP